MKAAQRALRAGAPRIATTRRNNAPGMISAEGTPPHRSATAKGRPLVDLCMAHPHETSSHLKGVAVNHVVEREHRQKDSRSIEENDRQLKGGCKDNL